MFQRRDAGKSYCSIQGGLGFPLWPGFLTAGRDDRAGIWRHSGFSEEAEYGLYCRRSTGKYKCRGRQEKVRPGIGRETGLGQAGSGRSTRKYKCRGRQDAGSGRQKSAVLSRNQRGLGVVVRNPVRSRNRCQTVPNNHWSGASFPVKLVG